MRLAHLAHIEQRVGVVDKDAHIRRVRVGLRAVVDHLGLELGFGLGLGLGFGLGFGPG